MSTGNGDASAGALLAWLQTLDRDELEGYRDELQGYVAADSFHASISLIALQAVEVLLMRRAMGDALRERFSGGEFEQFDTDVLCDAVIAIGSHRGRIGLENDAEAVLAGALEVAHRRTENERESDG